MKKSLADYIAKNYVRCHATDDLVPKFVAADFAKKHLVGRAKASVPVFQVLTLQRSLSKVKVKAPPTQVVPDPQWV